MAKAGPTISNTYVSPYAKFGKIGYILEVLRLPLCIMASVAGFTAGFIIIHVADPSATFFELLERHFWHFILGVPIPFMMVGAAQSINDVYDLESDTKNRRYDRPLVRGDLDPDFVKWFSVALLLIGPLLAGLLFGLPLLVACLFFSGLAFWYSVAGLKRSGVFGNLVVASGHTAPFLLGMMAIQSLYPGIPAELVLTLVVMAAISFFGAMGREFMKGIMDVEGDRAVGVNTLAVVHGPRVAATAANIFFLITVMLAPLPLFLSFRDSWIYLALISVLVLFLVYTIVLLVKSPTAETVKKTRFLTRYAFYTGSAAFFVAGFFITV